MECKVCLEKYNTLNKRPMVLECGHTFCMECLQSIKRDFNECPLDRQKITKPISEIGFNYSLLEVISSLESHGLRMKTQVNPKGTEELVITNAHLISRSHSEPSGLSKRRKIVYCSEMHEVSYNEHTSDIYASLCGDSNIICDICRNFWTGGSWQCSICQYDICNQCYIDQSAETTELALPDLKCWKGHPMYFYVNTLEYYNKKLPFKAVQKCQSCKCTVSNGFFSCRQCFFDICVKCKNKEILPVPHKCSSKHNLIFREMMNRDFYECANCGEMFSGASYNCFKCQYDLCELCFKVLELCQVKCSKNHFLTCINDRMARYKENYALTYNVCSSCEKTCDEEKSYHCSICNFKLCSKCYGIAVKGMTMGLIITCNNAHKLLYANDTCTYYGNLFVCYICKLKKKKVGSFHCRKCEYDICITCAEDYLK